MNDFLLPLQLSLNWSQGLARDTMVIRKIGIGGSPRTARNFEAGQTGEGEAGIRASRLGTDAYNP